MRKEYDLSKGKKNPYTTDLKKQVTIRLDTETINSFRREWHSLSVGKYYQSTSWQCQRNGGELDLNMTRSTIISNEWKFCILSHGIKLIPSDSFSFNSESTVSDLMKQPMCVYFEDTEGTIKKINEHNAEFCNFDSPLSAIGKKYFQNIEKHQIQHLRDNDSAVLKNKQAKIFEENIIDMQNSPSQMLSIKMPWYDLDNKLQGLFGCSIILGKHALASCLSELIKINLFHPKKEQAQRNPLIKLTDRQLQVANLLMGGATAKEIAKLLYLSPRTVEHYIDNLKHKLKCKNKTDLILKLNQVVKNR